jgi:flavodoxin
VEIQELKALIKETMREVLKEERLRLCQILIPYISNDEQRELEAEFGSPSEYADDEAVDMTDWVKHGNQISQKSA